MISLIGTGVLLSLTANAQQLSCAQLANSALSEPADYASRCGFAAVPAPSLQTLPNVPTDTAFTIDVRGNAPRLANTLYSFSLNAFPTQTSIGVTNPQIFALDFNVGSTTLFGVTGSAAAPNPSTLGTVNRTTGAFTPIAAVT